MRLLRIHRLGLDKARVLLVMGDGARWIWCGVREHLSSLGVEVVEILDFYRATEHLWKLANGFFGQGSHEAVGQARACEAYLIKGCIADRFKSLEALRSQAQQAYDAAAEPAKPAAEKLITLVEKAIAYFRNHESRIHHAEYLKKGYLIGSGAMEGSCRHHVKERIDRGGMQWSASGAMAVVRDRTLIKNGDWDAFWKEAATRRWAAYRDQKACLIS